MIQLLVARKKKRLSQKELGDLVGVSNVQISRIENGKVKPKSDLLKKLSDCLNVSIDYLVDEVEEKE